MPISARFAASFDDLQAGVNKAIVTIKTFETGAKNAARDVSRLAESFSGAKILAEATRTAAAIQSIGGVSQLTATEVARATGTMTEALAKLKATSQTVPPELQKISDELKAVTSASQAATSTVDEVGTSFGTLVAGVASGQAVFELAKRGLESLTGFVESSVESYARAQKAQEGMVQALRQVGQATPDTIAKMNTLAAQFQDTTVYSDDLINEMEGLFVTVGHVGPENMEAALTAATNLSAGLGIDLREATIQVSKAIEGHTTGLQKLGINIDEAAVKSKGASAVFEALNARFGGQAAAQMDTYAGAVARAANEWDNLKEAVGNAIVNDDRVKESLKDLPQTIKAATGEVLALIDAFKELSDEQATVGRILLALPKSSFDWGKKAIAAAKDLLIGNTAGPQLNNAADGGAANGAHGVQDMAAAAAAKAAQDMHNAAVQARLDQQHAIEDWDRQRTAIEAAAAAAAKGAAMRDRWLGNDVVAKLRDMRDEWNRLSDADKANALATGLVTKEWVDLASKLPVLPPELHDIAVTMNAAAEAAGMLSLPLSLMKPVWEGLGQKIDVTGDQLDQWNGFVGEGFERGIKILDVTKGLGQHFSELPDHIKKSTDALSELSQAFAQLAQVSGGAFGGIVQEIGQIVSAMALAQKASQALHNAIDDFKKAETKRDKVNAALNATAAGVSGAGAVVSATGSGSTLARTAGGALAGAEAGSAFGPIGTAIGAGIGGLVGLFRGLGNSEKKTVNKMRQDFVDAAGGLDVLNKHAHDAGMTLDNLLHASSVKSYQAAVDQLNAAFAKHDADVKQLISDLQTYGSTGTLATKAVLQGLAKVKAGTDEAAAAADYLKANTQTALTGLLNFVQTGVATTAAGAQALGASALAVFEELQREGATLPEALQALTPVLDGLSAQFKAAGVDGGAAFDDIASLAQIAEDKIAGPAVQSVAALNQVVVGLANNGLLTQDIFSGLSDQVTSTFDSLVAQGYDGNKVLKLMQPTLQTIFELQEQFGFKTDDATQALEDQAKAAGLVGDQFKDPQQKMLDGINALIDRIGKLIDTITGKGGVNDAINSIPRDVDVTVTGKYVPPDNMPSGDGGPQSHGGGPPSGIPGHARGGLFKTPHVAWIAEGGRPELVGDRGFVTSALVDAMQQVGAGGSGQGTHHTTIVKLNGQTIARSTMRYLPGETRTLVGR